MLLAALIAAAGLYPLQLPDGQAKLSARLTAQIAERAGLQVLPPSGCMPDEEVCLAGAAKAAGVERIVSAEFRAVKDGYYVHFREIGADQKVLREFRGEANADELPRVMDRWNTAPVAAPAPAAALPASSGMTVGEARSRAEFGLLAGGIGLLLAAGGAQLYSSVAQSSAGNSHALTQSSAPARANTLAIALAATGAGAVLGGAIIFAVTPESASLQARF